METEMYVYYLTNDYYFEKLENPPKYKPIRCTKCKKIISLGEDKYVVKVGGKFFVEYSGINWQPRETRRLLCVNRNPNPMVKLL
jgi:hypothetical protein